MAKAFFRELAAAACAGGLRTDVCDEGALGTADCEGATDAPGDGNGETVGPKAAVGVAVEPGASGAAMALGAGIGGTFGEDTGTVRARKLTV